MALVTATSSGQFHPQRRAGSGEPELHHELQLICEEKNPDEVAAAETAAAQGGGVRADGEGGSAKAGVPAQRAAPDAEPSSSSSVLHSIMIKTLEGVVVSEQVDLAKTTVAEPDDQPRAKTAGSPKPALATIAAAVAAPVATGGGSGGPVAEDAAGDGGGSDGASGSASGRAGGAEDDGFAAAVLAAQLERARAALAVVRRNRFPHVSVDGFHALQTLAGLDKQAFAAMCEAVGTPTMLALGREAASATDEWHSASGCIDAASIDRCLFDIVDRLAADTRFGLDLWYSFGEKFQQKMREFGVRSEQWARNLTARYKAVVDALEPFRVEAAARAKVAQDRAQSAARARASAARANVEALVAAAAHATGGDGAGGGKAVLVNLGDLLEIGDGRLFASACSALLLQGGSKDATAAVAAEVLNNLGCVGIILPVLLSSIPRIAHEACFAGLLQLLQVLVSADAALARTTIKHIMPKGCPGCIFLNFVCIAELHPRLVPDVERLLRVLMGDASGRIVERGEVAQIASLCRRSFYRGDDHPFPSMANCLDFELPVGSFNRRHSRLGGASGGDGGGMAMKNGYLLMSARLSGMMADDQAAAVAAVKRYLRLPLVNHSVPSFDEFLLNSASDGQLPKQPAAAAVAGAAAE